MTVVISGLVQATCTAQAQQPEGAAKPDASLTIHADRTGPIINRDIFGQFAEMLGEGVYGGIWVGPDSEIPNVRGIRKDVVRALREIKVPVVRWPGGCYADEYHWRNAVGPMNQRRSTLNSNWGGTVEPNTFGTDEFMDFVQQIDSKAYISVNLGSGSPEEAANWLEYMTTDKPTALGLERQKNGHPKPYMVQYLGLGNETWGCGGPMTGDEYVTRMKIFSHFIHNDNPAQAGPNIADVLTALASGKSDPSAHEPNKLSMQNIAVGPDRAGTEYTETVMQAWAKRQSFQWNIQGLSLHKYTFGGGFPFSFNATDFGEKEYATMLKETLGMDTAIATNSAIMDKYDPQKKVGLVVDEWGAWLHTMPGTNPILLKQQNSLRDAILAALNINIFARHADRVRMTNIAQMVNVIQSMILTDREKMLLTPTYYVYKMFVPFQDATFIPIDLQTDDYKFSSITMPKVDAIAAKAKDGHVWLALTNLDPNQDAAVHLKIEGITATAIKGEILTAPKVDSVNTFETPANVSPKPFSASATGSNLQLNLPPKSVVVVSLD